MRVLFWPSLFWPKIGGVEVHAAKLLPALRQRGHEFLVLTTQSTSDQPESDFYDGIPVYRLALWQQPDRTNADVLMALRRKVIALKRSFSADLVHISAVEITNFFHLTTAHVAPAPLLITLHGEWPERQNASVKQTLEAADWVAACSQAILDKGRERAPAIASRSSVIYNGVDTPALLPAPLPFDPPRLLCLGRLAPEKGFDVALDAFKILLRQFPEIRLTVAGDGVRRIELEKQAEQLGIHKRVDFLNWVDPANVPALINSATLLLMPSRKESLPLVALEAALMARPVVATRTGGLPEVLADGQTGLLADAEDADALAGAVRRLLCQPALAHAMGQAARLRAQRLFNWQSHVNSYDELYKKLASRPLASMSNP